MALPWDTGLGFLAAQARYALLAGGVVLAVGLGLVWLAGSGRSERLSRARVGLLLALFWGVALCSYFAPGALPGGDGHTHVARTWLVGEALSEGSLPFWTWRWYQGYPLGLYYGFLYYVASAALAALPLLGAIGATKLTLWAAHVASGFAMRALARRELGSETAALFAATAYVLSLQHHGLVLLCGVLPASFVFVLTPLLLLAARRLEAASIGALRAAWPLALVGALLIFTHVQYGLLALAALGVVVIARGVLLGQSARRGLLGRFALSGLLFAALVAWFVVPFALDSELFVLSSSRSLDSLIWHDPLTGLVRSLKLALWSRTTRDWVYAYVGLSVLGLAALGVWRAWQARDRPFAPIAIPLALLTPLMWLNPRLVAIWLAFLCLAAGRGALALGAVRLGRLDARALAMAFLLLDLGPGLIQLPYGPFGDARLAALGAELAGRGRLLPLERFRGTLWRGADVMETGASSLFGAVPQLATRSYAYSAAIAQLAASELIDRGEPELSRSARDGLRLAGVSAVWLPASGATHRIPEATPCVFAPRLAAVAAPSAALEASGWIELQDGYEARSLDTAFLGPLLARMELEPGAPVAARVLVADSEARARGEDARHEQPPGPEGGRVAFELVDFRETATTVRLRYRSSQAGYLRLAYAWFPSHRAFVDGSERDLMRSPLHASVVRVPAGEHEVRLEPGFSRARRMLLVAGGLLLLLVLLLATTPLGRRWQ